MGALALTLGLVAAPAVIRSAVGRSPWPRNTRALLRAV
jgi:hypothetical protein